MNWTPNEVGWLIILITVCVCVGKNYISDDT